MDTHWCTHRRVKKNAYKWSLPELRYLSLVISDSYHNRSQFVAVWLIHLKRHESSICWLAPNKVKGVVLYTSSSTLLNTCVRNGSHQPLSWFISSPWLDRARGKFLLTTLHINCRRYRQRSHLLTLLVLLGPILILFF